MAPTTFGASIVRSQEQDSSRNATLDSPAITPAASREDLTISDSGKQAADQSPFYTLSSAQPEPTHTRSAHTLRTSVNEKDIEAGATTPLSPEDDNPFASRHNVDCSKECKMWPSKQTLMQGRLAEKKQKQERKAAKAWPGCGPVMKLWGRFNKKQKLAIQFGLVILVVGIAVAIGVAISIAVHGSVYAGANQSKQIPQPQ